MKALKLRIMNIFFFIISAFSVAWLALKPFANVSVDWDVSKESLQQVAGEDIEKNLPAGITLDDIFSEGNIPINIEINVSNKMLIDVWTTEDSKSFIKNEVIQVNVNKLVGDLEEPLMKVAKAAAKGMVSEMLEEELSKVLGDGEDLYAKLGESGLGEEDVKESVGKVFDSLTTEGATVESVSEVLTEEYNTYFAAISDGTQTAMTQEQMQDTLDEALGEFGLVNEDGTIKDISEALDVLLSALLGGDSNEDDDGSNSEEPGEETNMLRLFAPNFDGEEDAAEENPLVELLTNKIDELLNDETIGYITLGFKIAGIALAVFILGWAIKVLQCLFRTFSKKPYIKKEIIGIISGIVQLLLAIVCGAVALVSNLDILLKIPSVGSMIYEVINPLLSKYIPSGLSVGLNLSCIIPGLLVIVNFILALIYGPAKRKFKKAYKKQQAKA